MHSSGRIERGGNLLAKSFQLAKDPANPASDWRTQVCLDWRTFVPLYWRTQVRIFHKDSHKSESFYSPNGERIHKDRKNLRERYRSETPDLTERLAALWDAALNRRRRRSCYRHCRRRCGVNWTKVTRQTGSMDPTATGERDSAG